MSVLKYRRFTRPEVLHQIGRPLLTAFFAKFADELNEAQIASPVPGLEDPEWFCAWSRLLCSPEGLPAEMVEALYAVDEMATTQGLEQLEGALREAGLEPPSSGTASCAEIALQVWLTAPRLLATVHNRQRLRRLSAFQYFRSPKPPSLGAPLSAPDDDTIRRLTAALDPWFARHHRGRNTTRIEIYRIAERSAGPESRFEYWFLIRHGDTFARAPKVEEQRTEIMHFRPQRDDVVVYSPFRDEIRINARTKGERELYVRAFGECLRAGPDYFVRRDTYTLDPLRYSGRDALQADGVPEIEKIVLRELQIALEAGAFLVTYTGQNLFQPPMGLSQSDLPRSAKLQSAAFDLHFAGCSRPRPLQIRPPNSLKVGRHCDLHAIHRWLSLNGFRLGEGARI